MELTIFIFIFLLFIQLPSAFYSAQVAHQKGYNGTDWGIGGFFFGTIALIAVAGLPDRRLRKYIRQIGEKQNAIPVGKESVEQSDELINDNTRISFSMPKDSTKEEIYKKLVDALDVEDFRLENYNVTSYNLDIDSWGKQFIVNSEKKDRLIVLVGTNKGNKIIWSGRI